MNGCWLLALGSFALLSNACTNFPDIPSGECGNSVIEANEDCDNFPRAAGQVCRAKGTVGQCHLDCSASSGGVCPEGWGCDSGSICREPSGKFEQPSKAVDVGAWSLTAGDFDGDGRDDVMSSEPLDSIGATRVRFLYFDAQGEFAESRQFPKLILSPTVVDLSDDDPDVRTSDVAFSDGRIGTMQGRSDRSWVPDTFSSYRVPSARVRVVGVLPSSIQGSTAIVSLIDSGQGAQFVVADPTSGMLTPRSSLGGGIDDLVGDPVSGDLLEDAKHSPCFEPVFALKGQTHFTLLNVCDTDPDTSAIDWRATFGRVDVALDPPLPIDAAPQIVDLNGDKHLDVLIGAGGKAFASYGDGVALAPAVPYQVSELNPGDQAPHSVEMPMPLAAGDFTGDAAPDFVFPNFLFISYTPYLGAVPRYTGSEPNRLGSPYTSARIADFNGNGKPDVVAASNAAPNLAFFNGLGDGNLVDTFVSTSAPVQTLVTGDFDGDLIDDLGIVDVVSAGQSKTTLRIAFGAPSRPLTDPVAIAQLSQPESVTVYRELGLDGMIVCSNETLDSGQSGALSFLGGSGDRVPFAPYALTEFSSTGSLRDYAAVNVAVGRFTGRNRPDLIALAFPQLDEVGVTPPTEPWLFADLENPSSAPKRTPKALDSRLSPITVLGDRLDFDSDVASATLDIDLDGRDEAVLAMPAGADRMHCGVVVLAASSEEEVEQREPLVLDEPCTDPQLGAADIDGDGFPDLILLTGSQGAEARKLHVLWNDGSGAFSADRIDLLTPAEDSPQAFSVVSSSTKQPLGIAFVTHGALRLVRSSSKSRTLPSPETLYDGLNRGTGVVAADVNGDRVQDLVVADDGKLRVLRAQLIGAQ